MWRRLPMFAVCWIATTAPWYGLMVAGSRVSPVRALACLAAGAAAMLLVGVLCRRHPVAWPVGGLLAVVCCTLGGISTYMMAGAHGSAEGLAFMMLALYLGAALFFAWGWYAELAIVVPTMLLWLWVAPSLVVHMPASELGAAIAIGLLLSMVIAEGANRNFRIAFLHQSAEKQARRALEIARDEAERARSEAEAATRAKDDFLATVSHELRSPIGTVLTCTHTLRHGRRDRATVDRALRIIEANARIQAHLIEDLLDVSRIVAGKMRLEIEPIDLRSPVRTEVESARALAAGARVGLAVDVPASPVIVRGDATRLRQVFQNLLTNAVKFTPAGGAVTVRIRSDAGYAAVSVEDNGVGIAPDQLRRIFERFVQCSAASKQRHGGLGLGLSITRNIVEMHGGSIEAASAGPGCGASFQVRIPLASAPPPARREETKRWSMEER